VNILSRGKTRRFDRNNSQKAERSKRKGGKDLKRTKGGEYCFKSPQVKNHFTTTKVANEAEKMQQKKGSEGPSTRKNRIMITSLEEKRQGMRLNYSCQERGGYPEFQQKSTTEGNLHKGGTDHHHNKPKEEEGSLSGKRILSVWERSKTRSSLKKKQFLFHKKTAEIGEKKCEKNATKRTRGKNRTSPKNKKTLTKLPKTRKEKKTRRKCFRISRNTTPRRKR